MPFWVRHPAMLVGLLLLVSATLALNWHAIYLLPLLLLLYLSPFPIKHGALALLFFAYVWNCYPAPPFSEAQGVAHFSISSLKVHPTPFHKLYLYTGEVKHFESTEGEVAKNIPCNLYLPYKKTRALANVDYKIRGSFEKGRFKPDKKSPWEPIEGTFSFAEWRFLAKTKVKEYLKHHFSNARVASFFSILTTGDIEDRLLAFEFNRLGLKHILAISGFHFGLLALFLGFILRLILPLKMATCTLLVLLTAYYLFIGNSPSVQRAWIACSLILVGYLIERRSPPLNALGVGLIVELLLYPPHINHLGFQLSFAATFALLLFYHPCHQLLKRLLPERTLKTIVTMTPLHQHGYLLSAFLRKTLALSLAIHLFTLPILLFFFHSFPLLSFFYNLFFPCWVALSLLLLLISFPLPFLHPLNQVYTHLILILPSRPPATLNYSLYFPYLTLPLLILVICSLCLIGIWLQCKRYKAFLEIDFKVEKKPF